MELKSSRQAHETARLMWTLTEPVHALTYFAPEARSAFEDAGLRGFWRGYFAGRAAPLGRVTAGPVIASFFNFAPQMVARALPSVWELASPEQALRARQAGAVAALHRLLDDSHDSHDSHSNHHSHSHDNHSNRDSNHNHNHSNHNHSNHDNHDSHRSEYVGRQVGEAADLLWTAVGGSGCAGRVLACANAELPVPDEPYAKLWHAATLLREHRGDGHFAALLAADIDGCEALVLQARAKVPRARIQPVRGWTDDEWEAAASRLADRGLLTGDGELTAAGRELSASVELRTDVAAARPWGDEALAAELAGVLAPISRACAAELPFPNPIGLPPATTPNTPTAAVTGR
ncbi:MAG TPA: hypothetical protein VFQ44_13680 [Streptosporangiaceae bacterium]|nr:hypothetical protein [Streptosporangiaceae bacterium]